MSHGITFTLHRGGPFSSSARVTCTEPDDALCRTDSECGCEEWYGVDRDEQGWFHLKMAYDEAGDEVGEVKHRMTFSGVPASDHCNIRDWLENSDCADELSTEDVDFTIPFVPEWNGDDYSWKPSTPKCTSEEIAA